MRDEAKHKVKSFGDLNVDDIQYEIALEMIVTLKGQDQLWNRLLETFKTIDMSSNRFFGNIPPSIGNLKNLRYLNLSHNSFIGHIPSSLGNMSQLELLDLSTNKLDGEIPSELTRLTFLAKLNLLMNNLTGNISQSTSSPHLIIMHILETWGCVDFRG
ncbi:receptor-like protein 33 [Salvia hispanica]|uniref:receptor-like protein 33 n=1 Tax=Salvia hispanica TaxID=49212 RepID=UPI002009B4F9|nr:receptor-like protein 33 [Salvia hispanica]